jgi:hypothetical protein
MVYAYLTGRIGNNLFQIATGSALAQRNNTGFTAIITRTWCQDPDNCFLEEYLKRFEKNLLRNVKMINYKPEEAKVFDQVLRLEDIPFFENICLHGLWQSDNYFADKRDHILELFSIDDDTNNHLLGKYSHILSQEVTSIVVRRGDFVPQPQFHPTCSMSYYKKAISLWGTEKPYLIISDDIEWCKTRFRGPNFFFADKDGPVCDFYLQTLCSHNIISNSTFAWWGAWLNPNPDKTVIAPRDNWFGYFYRSFEREDKFPENWILIPNPLSFRNRIKVAVAIIISALVPIKHFLEKKLKIRVKVLNRKRVKQSQFTP